MNQSKDLLKAIEKISEQEKLINDLENELSRRKGLEIRITNLKKEMVRMEKFINSTPQLSNTSIGRCTSDGKIIYRNWWISYKGEYEGILDGNWFTQFIQHHFPNEDYKLNFFSIWNNHYNIMEDMPGKKIFYTPSNLNKIHVDFNKLYGSYALDYVDLALGFDYIDNPKYFRLPYWFIRLIGPKMSDADIENLFEQLQSINFDKTENVSSVNSHDKWGTRALIANDVEKYVHVDYAGLWRRNTTDLVDNYNNVKINFLKKYKFNICSENVIDDGYVTEKIFDAIKSDCIPLYAGNSEPIEDKILNDESVLRWSPEKDNSDTMEIFKNLLTDKKSYDEFKDQKIILDSAAKEVIKKFRTLEKYFERLICE